MNRPFDPHLEPPWLLRNMPRLLVIMSFATMALMWVGVSWRLDQAREASLAAGERSVNSVSAAFQRTLEYRLQAAQQAAFTARELAKADPTSAALSSAVVGRLGLDDDGAVIVVADEDGRVMLSNIAALEGQRLSQPWRDGLNHWAVGAKGEVMPLPGIGSEALLTVTSSLTFKHQPAHLLVGYSEGCVRKWAASAMRETWGKLALSNITGVSTSLTYSVPSGRVEVSSAGSAGTYKHSVRMEPYPLEASLEVPRDWALKYHNESSVPSTIGISVLLAFLSWGVFTTAAIGFKRALIAQRELTKLVALDPLTGLPNRRSFTNLLSQGLASSQRTGVPYGLLFIDLDNFKYVNDTHGHDAGDLLLKEVARRLSAAVRASDYVCRLGGDEFVVLLTTLERSSDAEDVSNRILEALAQPIQLGDADLRMGASLGIAVAPRDAQTASQLVICADMAVYRAKADGKGCFAFFDPSLKAKAEARARISQDIRRGIDRNEFVLMYQPKLDLRGREACGFEALMRWQHHTLGLMEPGAFIAVAEETGLIEELGDVALRLAIGQLRTWFDQGHGWKAVAVNVSARQLREARLSRRVEGLLSEHAVPGHCLQIELTESMLAHDEAVAARVIKELKQMGVRVSVDDFGTGYSSMSALQRYDVDYLKIDRSFVRNIETDADSLEICRAIVQMAHALKVRTIAEGIETPGQFAALLHLDCDEGQGFFMAPPMAPAAAIAWTRPAQDFVDSGCDLEV